MYVGTRKQIDALSLAAALPGDTATNVRRMGNMLGALSADALPAQLPEGEALKKVTAAPWAVYWRDKDNFPAILSATVNGVKLYWSPKIKYWISGVYKSAFDISGPNWEAVKGPKAVLSIPDIWSRVNPFISQAGGYANMGAGRIFYPNFTGQAFGGSTVNVAPLRADGSPPTVAPETWARMPAAAKIQAAAQYSKMVEQLMPSFTMPTEGIISLEPPPQLPGTPYNYPKSNLISDLAPLLMIAALPFIAAGITALVGAGGAGAGAGAGAAAGAIPGGAVPGGMVIPSGYTAAGTLATGAGVTAPELIGAGAGISAAGGVTLPAAVGGAGGAGSFGGAIGTGAAGGGITTGGALTTTGGILSTAGTVAKTASTAYSLYQKVQSLTKQAQASDTLAQQYAAQGQDALAAQQSNIAADYKERAASFASQLGLGGTSGNLILLGLAGVLMFALLSGKHRKKH